MCRLLLDAKGTSKKQKKKRTKAAQPGKQIPQSVREALESDKPMKWIATMNDEINGLIYSGVLVHDQSYQDLIKAEILSKPVPLGMYFDEQLNNRLHKIPTKHVVITRPTSDLW